MAMAISSTVTPSPRCKLGRRGAAGNGALQSQPNVGDTPLRQAIKQPTMSLNGPPQKHISVYLLKECALLHTQLQLTTYGPLPLSAARWRRGGGGGSGLVYCSISYYSPCLLAVKIHQFSSFFFLFSSFVSVRFKSESLLSQLYVNAIRPRLSHLRQGVSLHNINQILQRCNGWDSLFFKINDAEGKTCLVSISSQQGSLLIIPNLLTDR